ncbi:MAG: adenosylcobalamin-dependent ribonucleoside-diphosphate reductase [Anaerolineae bacterium]|uniref:adenosylcobalamin-dependent ribonucleoside-diphosphate reductase n=1 Tax=Promineifilum sp. TaxID=2664178 RepID=UPI001D1CB558|nr:adenosylcobalamin-dependent ribonucleoside-diphosphate reductase [Anaerolineales bacterium]MCB8934026.1 adenosylcobalamin-dependent ribonucleoside-diphosphate reductase [Promineifilum sp.]MCO5179427.1 adenosylcobalamin-dependent ribonucleoside-diphosphate reductase [Promineifilum sp.]MCW5845858.1 adenosylcobalamin-dependent ribonucleoside-diphosphate reductase [Anaerolineae bacterium]
MSTAVAPLNDQATLSLPENSMAVLRRRYLRRGPDGQPIENVEEMFRRVAHHIALVEADHGADVAATEEAFYRLLTDLRFFPNSPTFTGAGTPLGQLAACFVLPIADDMGRDPAGIFQTLRDAALIQQTGGGNGFAFSRLRPKDDYVKSSAGKATGPVGFLRVYDQAFGEIAQGGTRRGANMAVLRVDHPDILEFISCKASEYAITNFNISVGVTDKFIHAVKDDADFDLINPRDGQVWRTVRARDIFDEIVKYAHRNGEPGVLFLDAANRSNPVPHLYELEATNPCGEQWLGPYENCCLGSINLGRHVTEDGQIDWQLLQRSTEESTHFLDNVVTANAYVPAVPQLRVAALNARRIGLGIMGLGDLFYRIGVRYGSEEGQALAGAIVEFIRYHSMRTSVELARERGPFLAIEGSIYDPQAFKWSVPQAAVKSKKRYGRPALDWDGLVADIQTHGIRNAAQTTVAPTGTIATVAGIEGYGCEPVFALAYVRHVNDNGKDLQLQYTSPLFERALLDAGLDEATRQEIIDEVNRVGSCQHIDKLPAAIRNTFVVSSDITPEEHVRMQAAIQAFVDNSISKTCNFPAGATPEAVAEAYMLAWDLGCKGLTVYVTGSRETVTLETHATKEAKAKAEATAAKPAEQLTIWRETKKPRSRVLHGETSRISTPLGATYVTINHNGDEQPFEVFIQTAKAGSDTAAVSEAIGRLISYNLRLASPVSPRDRLKEVVNQLSGIGGGRPLGFGPQRVLSLPDGVAQVLAEFLDRSAEETPAHHANGRNGHGSPQASLPAPTAIVGDLCPDCGNSSLVNEEGCRKCNSCGYSEC